MVVDEAGKDLLTHAGLTQNQNWNVSLGHLVRYTKEVLHLAVRRDNVGIITKVWFELVPSRKSLSPFINEGTA